MLDQTQLAHLLRRVPVGIRARVYRWVMGALLAVAPWPPILVAVERPTAAAVVGGIATALGAVSAALAAANTPKDFRFR